MSPIASLPTSRAAAAGSAVPERPGAAAGSAVPAGPETVAGASLVASAGVSPPALAAGNHRVRVALVLLAAAGLAAVATLLPVQRWALELTEWVRGAGALGIGVFAVAYVLAALLLLPGSLLTLGAGFAWGPVLGSAVVSPVSVAAATCAFLVARAGGRRWVSSRIAADPRLAAIDAAVARGGFRIVLLLRLSPVLPFNLLNYALGLTRVRLSEYVLASFLGMLPGTVLFVYAGSGVTRASELLDGRGSAGPGAQALFWGGLVATAAVTVTLTRLARRELARALATGGKP